MKITHAELICSNIFAKLLLVTCFVVNIGCSGSIRQQSLDWDSLPLDIPRKIELTDVPFYPQEDFQCGPASLAMAMSYKGRSIHPTTLSSMVFLPGKKGSLQSDLITAARRLYFLPYKLDGSVISIVREVAAGKPVIVLQNLGFSWFPRWHYALVVGYNSLSKEFILRSGTTARQVLGQTVFENTWARAKNWAIVILKPQELPQTLDRIAYLQAVIGLEKAKKWSGASLAYQNALRIWPRDEVASVGLANCQIAIGEFERAATVLKEALTARPKSPALRKNYAHVLMKLGKNEEASIVLESLKAGNSPHQQHLMKTRRQIAK